MISETDIQSYERDGATCVRGLLSPETAAKMLQASLDLMGTERREYRFDTRSTRSGDTQTVEDEPGRFFSAIYMSETLPIFREFALSSALPEAAATMMRSEVTRFFYDQLFIKDPGTASPTLWHHDLPFWPMGGTQIVSCWVALTPVRKQTSGVEYLAGSHKSGKIFRPNFAPTLQGDAAMEQAPDYNNPANRIAGERFLSWDLRPGDVLFHHPLTLHGAGGNSTEERRVGLSIRYLGDDVQWRPRDDALKLPRNPRVRPGAYPADNEAFPIVWQAE